MGVASDNEEVDDVHNCAYNSCMNYQWDPQKARSNLRKHGVRFADAVIALEDDFAITIPDDYPYEERYVTIGRDDKRRLLVVIYTWRGDDLRIISVRKATRRERGVYFEG